MKYDKYFLIWGTIMMIILLSIVLLSGCSHCNGKTFWGVGEYKDENVSMSSGFPIGELRMGG